MKKYLIVLAAALVALAGCKNNGGGNEYTNIRFKNATLEILVGSTDNLQVLYEPTTIEKAPVCEWSSSDTTIVTVDQNGNIEAIDLGEANVTAKYGELKAVCKVSVVDYQTVWEPSSTVYYFPSTKSAAPVSDTVITYTSEATGVVYTCKLYSVQLCIPGAVDMPNEDPGVSEFIYVTATIPFIEESTSGKYVGEPWDLAFQIVPSESVDTTLYGAQKGSLDPAIIGPVWQAYFEARAAGEEPSFDRDTYVTGVTGAYLKASMVEDGSILSYPWVDGVVAAGLLYTAYNEDEELVPVYKLAVDWCAGFAATGLAMNEAATGYADAILQPFELDLARYIYEDGEKGQPATNAPQKKAPAAKNVKGMINHGKASVFVPVKAIEAK